MTIGTEFIQTDNYELPSQTHVDVEQDRIVIASEDHIVVVTPENRRWIDIDQRVDDIAIGKNVYLCSGSVITAFTETGTKLWTREFDTICGIAATGGNVAVLQDGTTIEIINGTTSSQRALQELPHPNLRAEEIYAAKTGFLITTWTYLTRINLSGTIVYNKNLNAKISAVGAIGDQAVTALKDGTLRSVDKTGSEQWNLKKTITALTASGTTPLIAVGKEQSYILQEDGEMYPLEIPVGATVTATDGLKIVCVIDADGTVRQFSPSDTPTPAEQLDADIPQTAVRPEGTIEVMLTNKGETPVTKTVNIQSNKAELAAPQQEVAIDPGQSMLIETAVSAVEGDGDIHIAVVIDGDSVTKKELPVASLSDVDKIDIETAPVALKDGKLTVEVQIKNDGSQSMDDIEIPVTGQSIGSVGPHTSKQFEIKVPQKTDRPVKIVGQILGQSAQKEIPVASISDPIDITLTSGCIPEPHIEARFENQSEIPVHDEITIDAGSVLPELSRETTIPSRSAETVVVFFTEAPDQPIPAEASVSGMATATQSQLLDWNSTSASPQKDSENAAISNDEIGRTTVVQEDCSKVTTATSAENGPEIEVERSIVEDAPTVDRCVTERLRITNTSGASISEAAMDIDGQTIQLPKLAEGESVQFRRGHMFRTPGTKTLPGGTVYFNDTEIEVPPEEVEVVGSQRHVKALVRQGNQQTELAVTVESGDVSPIKITQVTLVIPSIRKKEQYQHDEFREQISDGGRFEFVVPVSEDLVEQNEEPVGVILHPSAVETTITTLAEIKTNEPSLEPAILNGRVVKNDYSTLSIEFENTGRVVMSGLRIEANTPYLDEYYAPKSVETLHVGETETHDIDLIPADAEELTIELSTTWLVDGKPSNQSWTISGPVADQVESWDETYLEKWTINTNYGDEETSLSERTKTRFVQHSNNHGENGH